MANKKSALEEAKSLLSSLGNKAKSVVSNFQQDYNNFKTSQEAKKTQARVDVQNFLSDSNPNKRLNVRGASQLPIYLKEIAGQTLNTTARDLGNTMRVTGDKLADQAARIKPFKVGMDMPTFLGLGPKIGAIPVNPEKIVRTMTRGAANTAEAVGSGVTDLLQSGSNWYKNPWDLKNYAQAVRGVGKIGFQALPITTGANLIASSNDQGVLPRISAGFIKGGSGVQNLAPNVQEKRIKIGPVEFDPAMAGGQMFGFIKNPVNQKLFELTSTYLPTSGSNIKSWLMTTGIRGGVENLILSLPDMPNGSAADKAKYLTENFAIGAGQEIVARGAMEGVKATPKYSVKFLSKVFDELSQLKEKMLTKVEEPNIKLSDIGINPPETKVMAPSAPEVDIKDIGITPPGEKTLADQLRQAGKDLSLIRQQLKAETDRGVRETLINEEKYLRQLYTNLKKGSTGEGFTQAAQEAMNGAQPAGPIKVKAKGEGSAPTEGIVNAFKNWVNARRAGKVEGYLRSQEFKNLDQEGINAILRFQAGDKAGMEGVQKYFDAKHAELKKAGVDMGFQENYLPQIWDNSSQEIQKVFGKKLSVKPSFTMERMIEDYKTGIEAGLKPKFSNISDLVRWYEASANKAIADKGFFTALLKDKFIMPEGKAPADWVEIKNIPGIKGKTGYQGRYKAERGLADKINNYLDTPALGTSFQRGLAAVAGFASSSKNRLLSFGIPGTGINAHGFNILARSFLDDGARGLLKTGRDMLLPGIAESSKNKLLPTAPDAIKHGLTLSTNEFNNSLEESGFKAQFGNVWDNLFEKPLFEKIIPARKLEGYERLTKEYSKSMPLEEAKIQAAHIMNAFYGGANIEELGRSKDFQNVLRTFILAPDWLESNITMGKETAKALLHPKTAAGKAYRRAVTNFVAGYVVLNLLNKFTSGHFMVENDPGKKFQLEAGYTADGQKRYISPFGTAIDFAKIPLDIASAALRGDFSTIGTTVRNRTSTIVQPMIGLATDTNWAGQKIGYRGVDKYGRKMEPGARALSIGSELATPLGIPSFLKQGVDYATGQQGLEQSLTQAFELPVKYAGGPKSETQKEVADLIKVRGGSGKDIYDVSKKLSGEALSDNQMGLITQSSDPIKVVNTIIKAREDKKAAKDKAKAAVGEGSDTKTAVDGGEKFYIVKGDSITAIDKVWEPPELKLTGDENIDKVLKSRYKSAITGRINDIVTLLENNMISQEEASAELKKLKSVYSGVSGPAKAKKITGKLPVLKAATLKSSASKGIKMKAGKISLGGAKTPAKPASLRSSYQSTYKPIKIRPGAMSGLIKSGMPTTLGGVGRA